MNFLNRFIVHLEDADQTRKVGQALGRQLQSGDVVALFGDLGAGKTTMVKAIVASIAPQENHVVSSPTFVYLNVYESSQAPTIYHFDLYRLKCQKSFVEQGFEEYLGVKNAIALIEWPERIEALLPQKTLRLYLSHAKDCGRELLLPEVLKL